MKKKIIGAGILLLDIIGWIVGIVTGYLIDFGSSFKNATDSVIGALVLIALYVLLMVGIKMTDSQK